MTRDISILCLFFTQWISKYRYWYSKAFYHGAQLVHTSWKSFCFKQILHKVSCNIFYLYRPAVFMKHKTWKKRENTTLNTLFKKFVSETLFKTNFVIKRKWHLIGNYRSYDKHKNICGRKLCVRLHSNLFSTKLKCHAVIKLWHTWAHCVMIDKKMLNTENLNGKPFFPIIEWRDI
jgi:hypothetical protein